MKNLIPMLLGFFLLFHSLKCNAQLPQDSALYRELFSCDSLLFNIGFNTCDIKQFEALIADDFEFYHDKSGITESKEAFLSSIANGLCKLSYQPIRILVEGSLQVFPLEKDGVLYGAIQMGKHRFFAKEPDKEMYFTNIAKFTHIWILEKGQWKLKRGYSYDHQAVDE